MKMWSKTVRTDIVAYTSTQFEKAKARYSTLSHEIVSPLTAP